jgi:hypothetical protein
VNNHVVRVFYALAGEEISTKTKPCAPACHDPVNVPMSEAPAFAVFANRASGRARLRPSRGLKKAKAGRQGRKGKSWSLQREAGRQKLGKPEEAKAGAFAYYVASCAVDSVIIIMRLQNEYLSELAHRFYFPDSARYD